MKILVTGAPFYNYSSSIVKSLQQLGHKVLFISMVEFYRQCTYIERHLYKMGVKSLETDYTKKWNEVFLNECQKFEPETILTLNGHMFEYDTLQKLHNSSIKLILWMIDGVKRLEKHENKLKLYDKIYCFEREDLLYLKDKYGLLAHYCPVGYESDVYFPDEKIKRDIDISFVGLPSAKRVQTLQAVAKYAQNNRLTMAVYGTWWDKKYFWKKWRFAKKTDPLIKYTHNEIITAQEAANIYRRSKICLNINAIEHKSVNPRTFEILGTCSFQLMDRRENFDDIIKNGEHLIMYQDIDDLLKKIDYYLAHESEREQIATTGYNWVKDKYSIMQMLKKII